MKINTFLILIALPQYCLINDALADSSQQELNEVEVAAKNLRYEIKLDLLDSANIVGIEEIQRMQASDVFSVLESIPGLTIDGGLTTGGKSFSIRGFGENEDVLVQIDGVTQNFEKYRAGTGVEIEPDLLKEIAVYRGGSNVSLGAGYLGGVVQMETKDARDYLDGRRIGATLRGGYNTNNYGKLYSITSYALPFTGFDLLVNAVKRDTNDFKRPNRRKFPNSDEQQESLLAKAEFYNDDIILSYSYRQSEDAGIKPFDLVEQSSIFANQFRLTEETANSFRTQWNPPSNLIKTDLAYGLIDKKVTEQAATNDADSFVPLTQQGSDITFFAYDIWTGTLKNEALITQGPVSELKVVFGIQAGKEERFSEQRTHDKNDTDEDGDKDEIIMVEYALQPSGAKETLAYFFDLQFQWESTRLQLGMRHNKYSLSPLDPISKDNLIQRTGSSKIKFDKRTFSVALDKTFGALTVYYHYSEAFAAPLITQYFTHGANGIGGCDDFSEVFKQFTQAQYFKFPNQLDENGLTFEEAKIQRGIDLAKEPWRSPDVFFCGPVYKPEDSVTQEIGYRLNLGEWINTEADFTTKLTYFETKTNQTLDSIRQNPTTLRVTQPGTEFRSGIEFELAYKSEHWLTELNLSTLNGHRTDLNEAGTHTISGPLRAPPGDSINFTLSRLFDFADMEIGFKVKAIRSRLVDQNEDFTASLAEADPQRVAGYVIAGLFSSYSPTDNFKLRFSIENLTNKEYQLRGFGGNASVGNVAAGRDYRFTLQYTL